MKDRLKSRLLLVIFASGLLFQQAYGANPSITAPTLPYSITINEGDVSALSVDITAQDADSDLASLDIDTNAAQTIKDTFKLTLQGSPTSMSITKTLGLQLALDYETDMQFLIPITIVDGIATVSVTFTVNVADLIDEDPAFGSAPYSVTINETSVTGTSVLDVAADVTDADSGDTLTYTLSGTDSNLFRLDPTSGIIYTAQKLDYDTGHTSFLALVIHVTDSNSNTATAQLDVTIDDVNDEPPVCNPSVYVVNSISENEAANALVATIACTDADSTAPFDTLNYVVNSGDDTGAKFALGLTNGLLKTSSTALDADTKDRYELEILVTDNPSSTPINTATVTVIVQVGYENDNTPAWTTAPSAQTLAENVAVGTTLMTLAASDADVGGTDAVVAYALVSAVGDDSAKTDMSALFHVDKWGGQVTTAGLLDAEGGSGGIGVITLTISATDQGTPPNSISATMAVTLNDVNEFAPQFAQSLHIATVAEGSAVDTSVLDLSAVSDGDRDAPTLTYAFGASTSYFKFHASNTNEIDTKAVIDLDSGTSDPASYTLVCTVDDGGGMTGTTTVIITVTSSNDHDPAFVSLTPDPVNVPEDSGVGHSVARVTFSDDDFGTHGDITFEKGSGDTNNNFQVDASTGVIRLQQTLDFDTLSDTTIDLEILAVDAGSRTGSTTVTVTVTDVSDELPTCNPGTHTVTVSESESPSFTVTTVTCSDADAVDSPTFAITNGNPAGHFAIGSTTGVITLANALNYDSATQNYQLEITYSDGTNHVIVQVAVAVGAVNVAPAFSSATYSVTKAESLAVGGAIYTMVATDNDYAPHDVVSYVFDGSSSGAENFAMVQETGVITLAKALDYETRASHTLVVTATDGGGLTDQATLTVTVSNVNDNTPSCSPLVDAVDQAEGDYSSGAVTLVTITCTDGDGDSLSYTLAEDPSESAFSNTNGVIQATGTLDFEGTQFYELTLTVSDSTFSTVAEVTVTVTAVNEGGPSFTSSTFSASVTEGASLGHTVGTFAATDPDLATHPHGNLIYSITSGNDAGAFLVDSSTGEVTVSADIDYETTQSYTLGLQVDEEAGSNSDTATLTITVTDVDDVAPTCTTGAFSVSVAENVFSGSAYTVSAVSLGCSDDDTSSLNGGYAIASGDTSVFGITAAGALQIISALDFDSGTRKYDLELTVTDGTAPALTIPGTVTVTGVNEDPPVFTQTTYTPSASESAAVGSSISAVTANDADSADTADGQVTYSFSGTPPSQFLLSETTGDILLKTALDYETDTEHVFEVEATDGGNTATATVTITVTDENDNPPVFQADTYSGSVAENAAGGVAVVTVQATDDDDANVNDNGLVAFSIHSGDASGVFAISSSTGAITVSGSQTVDYETATQYNLVVYAKDDNGGSGANTASVNVLITVTPDNEATPAFGQVTYTVTNQDEDLAVGDLVVSVAATDADRSTHKHGIFDYSMNAHANFYLDSASGDIRVKSALDFEATPSYTLIIYAIDSNGDSDARTGSCTVQINLQDLNDVGPSCTLSTNVHTYAEDVTISSTNILDLSSDCSDSEASPNGDLGFAITSVNGVTGTGIFALGASSGVLTFASQPNFETASEYVLIITVTDGGSSSISTTVEVTVTITDVNEGTPSFSGQQNALSIAENTAVGTSILNIVATDSDTADTLTYTLASSEFVIDASTGDLRTTAVLDRETTASYSLQIVATDDNPVNTLRSATHALTITITDVNDVTPHFIPAAYSVTIDEDASVSDQLVTVTATDEDSGANGNVAYALVSSSNPGTAFGVDASTGVITVANALDYETLTSYDLEVTATDGTTTSTTIVNVVVGAVNDHPPVFSPASPTFTVSEDESVTTSIGAVAATDDDDGTDGVFTYSIVSGDAGKFSINPSNGDLTLIDTLDFESTTSYTLTVRATDQGTNPSARSGDATVVITVTDVNDNSPVCNPVTYSVNVAEDGAAGDAVVTVTCTDADTTGSFNSITYAIQSGNGDGHFALGSSNGQVTLNSGVALDFESGTTSFTLAITATDAASNVDMATVNVQVTGVNEDDPVYTSMSYTPSVDEDAAVNDVVTTIAATDADNGPDGDVTYHMISGNNAGHFNLDQYSGVLTVVGALDYEGTQSYSLVVHAIDGGASPRTAITTVTVSVNDLNDNAPSCSTALFAVSLQENSAASTAVVAGSAMGCTDADDSPNGDVTCSLDSTSNVNSAFGVGSSSCDVTVNSQSALDIETTPSWSLLVLVSDSATVPADRLTATVTIVVTLTDVNEAGPSFTPGNSYTANVAENAAAGTAVKTVVATDSDVGANGDVTYAITSGNSDGKFRIDSVSGVVSTQDTLDREDTASYTLTITATDGGGSSTAATLAVTVTDINDETPACGGNPYTMSVAEDASVNDAVGSVSGCTDDDVDVNNVLLVYAIVSGDTNNHLDIDSATGLISVNAALDYETTKVYYLVVEVEDSGSPALTGTAYVTVAVTPVNEYDPVITVPVSGLTASVAEDASVGTAVITIASTDTDDSSQADGQARYSITGGNSQNHFVIDEASGVVSVSGALDREATASYSLTIRATDNTAGSGSERTDEETLTVTVTDVNDNYPVFTPSAYSVSVLESASVSATVAQVTTTDDDSGANAVATYSIVSGNSDGKFSLSGDEILLAATVDFETTPQYTLYIRAEDPALSSTAVVVVNIESVNEYNPALDTSLTSVTVAEDIAIGASIYQAMATDSDNGDYGSVVFAITNGNPGDSIFAIDVTSGDVTVASFLDYDTTPQSYSLEITASDNNGEGTPRTDVITVTVTLTDVNDNPPVFTQNTYSQAIAEDHAGTTSVLTVAANDADSTTNADITYAIISGDGVGKFTIDGASGEIATVMSPGLDFETKTSFTLHVSATDSGTPALSSACTVLITLTDVNDNDPVFDQVTLTASVAENQAAGVSLAQLAATDDDTGSNAALTFSIDASTDPTGLFALVSLGSNTVQLDTAAGLDRETTDSYTLEILAVDGASVRRTGTATVLVTVTDENDQTPAFAAVSYSATFAEDTPIGTSVLQVAATDADDGTTVNAELRFSIVSGNTNNAFTLDTVTGVLRVANTLDRETTSSYSLGLQVTDQGTPPDSATVTATLTITDVNDNPPVFAGVFYLSVAENVPNNTLVGTITASDADTGTNAVVYYSLLATSVGTQDHFWVETDTGNVYANTDLLDRESVDSYLLVVRAQNNGSPLLYDDTEVNVTITDVNDIIPLLSSNSYTVNLFENSPVGAHVMTVSAADNDLAQNMVLTYSLQGTPADTYFTLDAATGIVTLAVIPDRETQSYIIFTIYATDNGSPALEDSAPVTVYFDDVNDNTPVFSQSFYTGEIAHDEYLDGRTILSVLATDADEGDNALVHYAVLEPANEFMVHPDTGAITRSAASLDPNAPYVFTVQGQDTATSPLASSATVRIDTFPSNVVLVALVLEITEASFLSQQTTFEDTIESYLTNYPNIEIHVYKVQENPATAANRRRRLLTTSTSTITVYLYAIEDGRVNATSSKVFLTDTELLALLQGDGTNPADFLTGAAFAPYGITTVEDFDPVEEGPPWWQTNEGLTVIISCSLIGFIMIIIALIAIVWCCCRRKNVPITTVQPSRATAEAPIPPSKKNLPPPIIVLPEVEESAARRNRPPTDLEGLYRNKALWRTVNEVKKRPPPSREPVPRDSPIPPVIENRQFDGRAFDPASGRVYEYNTKTNERRWLTSSTGSRSPPPDYDSD